MQKERINKKIKTMKKYLLISFILFSSNTIFAQIDKIVGNWSETMCIRTDTTDSGYEELNKDWQAYVKGYKKLDPMYTDQSLIVPKEGDKLKVTIIKEEDFFWATDGNKLKEKIKYTPGFKEYLITIQKHWSSYSYIVKYETKTDKLLFLDHRSQDICHEFERKE